MVANNRSAQKRSGDGQENRRAIHINSRADIGQGISPMCTGPINDAITIKLANNSWPQKKNRKENQ